MLTFLSVLAVVLGAGSPQHDPQPRVTATAMTPSLPELRPTPPPAAPVPVPGTPAPEPYRLPVSDLGKNTLTWVWELVTSRPDLAWWGRRQTDGG